MKSVNKSRILWNTGTVSAENLSKREVRTTTNERTDNVSGQLHHYITSSFGELKC